MSQESSEWLNQNVLIGNTEVRGNAWHYRAASQGTESNHYPRFIPVADVERRLFAFDPVSRPAASLKPAPWATSKDDAPNIVVINGEWFEVVVDTEHQAICDPDQEVVFHYPSTDYAIHNYREWLLKNVATILDDDLGITSAGLLRRRAQAWVEISVPESITTPEGVQFLPLLLAWTSLDTSLATTYGRRVNETVCDNTLHARIGEPGGTIRFKHTTNSLGRITEVRQALDIVYATADDFAAEVAQLCNVSVTDAQWQSVLQALVPLKDKENAPKSGRSLTIALNKQDALSNLYNNDPRCKPWKGTKFGVIQTFNTHLFHEATIRNTAGGGRPERNQIRVLSGQSGTLDHWVAATVDNVLVSA
jgi:phage/plasmid-like protein (TIGR03299 family)